MATEVDPYQPSAGYYYDRDGSLKLKVKPRQAEVYVDGGVRSGLDVLVAASLGADAVFVGRPQTTVFQSLPHDSHQARSPHRLPQSRWLFGRSFNFASLRSSTS